MRKKRQNFFIAVCTVPTLIIFALFVIYPMIKAFIMALYRWSGLTAGTEVFIGIDNFKMLFQDQIFWKALKNNFILMFTVPPITMAVSMLFAVWLTRRKLKEVQFFRVVFFFPNVLSIVVISILWSFIYNPTFGILNSLLKALNLEGLSQMWLGDSKTALGAIAVTMIWAAVGWYMVLYIAAIENIPKDLYEAAVIDGAGELRQFTSITFPLIWEITRVTIIFFITNVFNNSFSYVRVMTAGGPDNASEVLSNYMYSQAFGSGASNMGYATAIAIVIFAIVMVLSVISNRLTEKEAIQY